MVKRSQVGCVNTADLSTGGQTSQVWKDKTLRSYFSSCWLPSSQFLSPRRPTHRYRGIPIFIGSGKFVLLPKHNKDKRQHGRKEKGVQCFLLANGLQLFLYKCPSLCRAALWFQGEPTQPPALGADLDWSGPISPYQSSDPL